MTHINLRDPEHRRDVLIVIGLIALGILGNVLLGLVFVWLLQSLGWWDALFATGR